MSKEKLLSALDESESNFNNARTKKTKKILINSKIDFESQQ